jgi:hypothetical protein
LIKTQIEPATEFESGLLDRASMIDDRLIENFENCPAMICISAGDQLHFGSCPPVNCEDELR